MHSRCIRYHCILISTLHACMRTVKDNINYSAYPAPPSCKICGRLDVSSGDSLVSRGVARETRDSYAIQNGPDEESKTSAATQ